MNKTRIAIIAALIPVGIALIAGIVFGIDRAVKTGEILGTVSVEGVDLGGLGRDDAAARLAELEAALASTPIEVTAAGHTFSLVPSEVGYDLDTEAMLEEAFTEGRTGNWFGQLGWWFGHFGATGRCSICPPPTTPMQSPLLVDEWEIEGIDDPPSPGNVQVVDYEVEYEYPRAGTGIDRAGRRRAARSGDSRPRPPGRRIPHQESDSPAHRRRHRRGGRSRPTPGCPAR